MEVSPSTSALIQATSTPTLMVEMKMVKIQFVQASTRWVWIPLCHSYHGRWGARCPRTSITSFRAKNMPILDCNWSRKIPFLYALSHEFPPISPTEFVNLRPITRISVKRCNVTTLVVERRIWSLRCPSLIQSLIRRRPLSISAL